MTERKLKLVCFIVAVCVLAAASSIWLLGSSEYAIAVIIVIIPMITLFVEPFVGTVIYLVYLYVRPHEFVPGLGSFPLIMVVGGSAFAGVILRSAVYDRKPPSLSNSPQDVLLLCLFAAMLLSHLGHLDMSGALKAIDAFLPVLVLYFLITNVVTNQSRLGVVLAAIAFSALVIATIGIIEFHTGLQIAETSRSPSRLSAVGWSNDPNILAVTLLTVVPFLFIKQRQARFAKRVIYILLLSVIFYASYQTNSRGGMLTLGAVLAVLIWRTHGVWKGLLTGIVLFVLIFKFGPSRMQEMSLTETSAHGRMISLADGLKAFWSNPFVGIGAYGWSGKWGVLIPHCSFIRCAAEVGLFGLVAWVLLGFISLKNLFFVVSRRRDVLNSPLGVYSEAIMFGCGAFLTGAMFLPIPYYFPLYVFFALSAAATNIFVSQETDRYALFESKDFAYGLLLSLGGLVGFEVLLRLSGVR